LNILKAVLQGLNRGFSVTHKIGFDLADFLAAEIAIIDQNGAILHCNRKWQETAEAGGLSTGQSSRNYIEECEAAIERGCDVSEILTGLRAVLQGEIPSFVATYPCPLDGVHHWFEVLVSALEIAGRRHAVLMHVDVSAMQRDPLTRLPNRTMFDAQLQMALSLARETNRRTGIIILDMNNLKLVNDKYGHQTGDDALRKLAAEIQKKTDPRGMAARIGGDEFGVVLPVDYDSLSARRMRAHFRSGSACTIEAANSQIFISASVGIAVYPADGTSAGELFEAADKSMYEHKRSLSVG
jgi:diguanylate cyclase (GGDEF)-like protein